MSDPTSAPPGDDAPENCHRCHFPLPADVADWWLSAAGVDCSQACADGGSRVG